MKEQNKEAEITNGKGTCSASMTWKANKPLIIGTAVIVLGILVSAGVVRSTPESGTANQQGEAESEGTTETVAAGTKSVAWRENYDAALKEAAEKNMPVLLRFTANWCPPCKVMDASVWPDEKVASTVAASVIPVKIDIDRPAAGPLSERFGVRTIPTLIMVDARGNEFARGTFMGGDEVIRFVTKRSGG